LTASPCSTDSRPSLICIASMAAWEGLNKVIYLNWGEE
jgi:hypothetical protein